MRTFLALSAVLLVAAAPPPLHDVAMGQVRRGDGIHLGSKNVDVIVEGNIRWTSPDGGPSLSATGLSGTNATIKADIIDAGLIYAQGTGPISKILPFTTAAIDFANATIVCEDSAGTTVTGAAVGDPCFVGMPDTLTAGGTGLHHTFTCYVSATNTIKVRACAAGTADNPGSVVFKGFVISSVQ